jgi:CheY-like chemotaxis protein
MSSASHPPPSLDHDSPGRDLAGEVSVLVVEDDDDGRAMLGDLLELLGHRVRTAASGPEALALAQVLPPELALIDISLPGMSGHAVARRLRERFGRAGPLLVAITGHGADDDRRASLDAGFDEHLVKPVELTELVRVLARARRRGDEPMREAAALSGR